MIVEYRESKAFQLEIIDGSAAALEIAFSNLLDRLAHDHLTLDLSSYILEDVLGVFALEGATSCPPTSSSLIAQSPKARPFIP